MLRKRGFVVSQAMLYAFGMIVIVMIFFWGYKSITVFSTGKDNSELNSFTLKFSKDMETLAYKRDSVREFEYDVPEKYTLFCVFDLNHEANLNSTIVNLYPELKDSVEDKSDNVFLIGKNKVFAIKSEYVTMSAYPYYSCQEIKYGRLSLSAKGAVYDGGIATQIIIDTKSRKELDTPLSGFNKIGDTYHATSDYVLKSTDGFAYMKILSGIDITLPTGENSLFIELVKSGDDSETYAFGPENTTFENNKLIIGLVPKTGECNEDNEYELGGQFSSKCEDGYAIFEFDKI